ncbi:MAG: MBL fold metallo-hydrolase [Pyrinomonadaceae bacterium]
MKIIVLGSGSSVPHPTRSSSAYWLETSGGSMLLDCSASAIHRMAQERCDWADLDAIWISHFHLDHCGGLPPFLFGTKYAPTTQTRTKKMRIFGPRGLRNLLDTFDSAYDYGLLEQPFPTEVIEIEPGKQFELFQGVTAKTFSTPHTDESCAIRITDTSGSMVFSADTGYSTNLGVFARDVDVLLIECSFIADKPVKTHLNLADIEQMARFAKPKKIVLTHLYPEWDGRSAPEEIGGIKTCLASDGLRFDVSGETEK